MLCFHAFWKQAKDFVVNPKKLMAEDNYSNVRHNTFNILQDKINDMIDLIQENLPWRDRYGWCLQKMHELRHMFRDMEKFGLPANFDASQGKRGLKNQAKAPATNALKHSSDTFLRSTTRQLSDRTVVLKSNDGISTSNSVLFSSQSRS